MNKFLFEMFVEAMETRQPIACTMEMTKQCNFRCLHCYITEKKPIFISSEKAINFIDQIVDMGCLYLTLTGGECLLHPDFNTIYKYAVKKGLIVSVFTNGSILTDENLNIFKLYPPKIIEITMYGYSNEMYELITKNKMFDVVKKNIISLKDNGINVMVKMFVMKENISDFEQIKRFAEECNVEFNFDFIIIDSAGSESLEHQINLDEIDNLKKISGRSFEFIEDEWHKAIKPLVANKLLKCGAGRINAHLSADNYLYMCETLYNWFISLDTFDFKTAWKSFDHYVNLEDSGKCRNCNKYKSCLNCSGRSLLFNGTTEINPVPFFCDLENKLSLK